MTDLFIDTDCISAFLWVNRQALLPQIFPGEIIMPEPVYQELSRPQVRFLKERVDKMISKGQLKVEKMDGHSEVYEMYSDMITGADPNFKVIGKGEASALALAKHRNGIIGSNNLRDIMQYIDAYNIDHLTTGDLLVMALDEGLIDENEGNILWQDMIRKRRKLGAPSFSDHLARVKAETDPKYGT